MLFKTNLNYIFIIKLVCMDTGVYQNNIDANCLFKFVNEIKSPDFLAKKCRLVGIQPLASEWGFTVTDFMTETLCDREVYVHFKVKI